MIIHARVLFWQSFHTSMIIHKRGRWSPKHPSPSSQKPPLDSLLPHSYTNKRPREKNLSSLLPETNLSKKKDKLSSHFLCSTKNPPLKLSSLFNRPKMPTPLNPFIRLFIVKHAVYHTVGSWCSLVAAWVHGLHDVGERNWSKL